VPAIRAFAALDEGDTALSPSSRAHVMLALGWLESTTPEVRAMAREALHAHAEAARPAATEPVGRVQLPFDAVMRVLGSCEALLDQGADAMPALAGAVHDFLVRVDDISRAARADRFHWSNLLSSVLPVEPESAAVGAIVAAAASEQGMEEALPASIDLPPAATIPLHIGLAVARRSRESGEERGF
jgi:hypothetical protein